MGRGQKKRGLLPSPPRFFCPRPTFRALSHLLRFDSRRSLRGKEETTCNLASHSPQLSLMTTETFSHSTKPAFLFPELLPFPGVVNDFKMRPKQTECPWININNSNRGVARLNFFFWGGGGGALPSLADASYGSANHCIALIKITL